MRKAILIFWILSLSASVRSQTKAVVFPPVFDFGTVAKWKNDTATFYIENTSASKFIFLPIGYAEELRVILPKGDILPGSRAVVKVIYYTQSRGNFRKDIPVYYNSSNNPIRLTIKGKIIDFHKDAMLECPSMTDPKPKTTAEAPLEIKVVDGISGKGLTGYNLIFSGETEYQLIESANKDKVYFDAIRNGKYKVNVSLLGYENKIEEIFVNHSSRKFIIKLQPEEEIIAKVPTETNQSSDEAIKLEKAKENEEEKRDIEKLRQKIREQFKGKEIIEKDVIVVQEGEEKPLETDTSSALTKDIPDYNSNGTLNENKYANNNLVFLIDVSGSMDKPNKMPYLKKSVKDMVKVLRKEDLITIIIYSSRVNVLLQAEPGNNKETICKLIDSLSAKGQSLGSEGMNMAYNYASRNFIQGGNNQVILVSDGLFNSSDFSPKKLYKLSKQMSEVEHIKTSAVGFGKNEDALLFMKTLAQNGSGNFIQILSENDAATVLIDEIMRNSKKAF